MKKEETKNDFIAAFWQLYEKNRIEKISIAKLCDLSGYNRSTFYSYYDNIYDLLDKSIDYLLIPQQKLLLNIGEINAILDADELMNLFLNILKTNKKYIEILIKNHHHFILEDKIKDFIIPLIKQKFDFEQEFDKKIEYIIEYQVSAFFAVIKKWLRNNKDYSEKELISLVYSISQKGVFKIILENVKVPNGEMKNDYDRFVNILLEKVYK